MASNLACIGLAVDQQSGLGELVDAIRPDAKQFGTAGSIDLFRWEDSGSGARVVLGVEGGRIVDLLPSLASEPTTRLSNIRIATDEVVTAAVVDNSGEQITTAAVELEQRRLLPADGIKTAMAAIVTLGRAVTVHPDAEAFSASPDSLLDPTAPTSEPPAHYVERGWSWPPRLGPESFISYGVFGEPEPAKAEARLSGLVVASERRTTRRTGQSFTVARVTCIGFETDVCMSDSEHHEIVEPGQIISGTVFLAASIPAIEAPPPTTRRSWWRRS